MLNENIENGEDEKFNHLGKLKKCKIQRKTKWKKLVFKSKYSTLIMIIFITH